MKRKALITTVSALALVAIVGVGSTLAYFTDNDTEQNTVTFGHVDIKLDEPEFSKNHKENTIEHVTPNQTIEKDPTITAVAGSEKMYLRVRIDLTGGITDMPDFPIQQDLVRGDLQEENQDEDQPITNSHMEALIEGINFDRELWVYNPSDGYYYYQNVVEKSEDDQTIPVFTKVKIPELWGNEVANMTFGIDVTAEAIQADNFTPTRNEKNQIIGWKTTAGEDVTIETYGRTE